MVKDREKIETALLCGYSYVEVQGVKIPLEKWELSPRLTRKQKEQRAKEASLQIVIMLTT